MGRHKGDWRGIKEGSQMTVKYTEKAGEKTAVGVKDLGKATAKAVDWFNGEALSSSLCTAGGPTDARRAGNPDATLEHHPGA